MATVRCANCFKTIESSICPHCGYPENPGNDEHQLPVGTLLRDRYQVGKALGQGGFGITYKGWDTAFERVVAIKEFYPSSLVNRQPDRGNSVFLNSVSTEPGFRSGRERFLREAQALSRVDHIPEIVRIYDFFQENNTAYIVMEYVRGVELGQYVRNRGGRLGAEETLRILKPVLDALETVHKLGLVHRDISPDNIMLDPVGGPKLLDFGAVRSVENPDARRDLEKSTETIVKHGFAPAEQYRGRGSLGPWTDLYALCATIYYCVTGEVPPDAVALAMGEEGLDWSGARGLSPAQRRALTKGMAPRAEDRYPDLGALRDALYGKEPAAPQEPKPKSRKERKPAPAQPAAREPIPVISREPAEMEKTCNVTDTREPSRDIPEEKPEGRKKNPVGIAVLVVLLLVVVSFLALIIPYRRSVNRYEKALSLAAQGQFEEAAELFDALGDYEDSADQALACRYSAAGALMEQGDYEEAAEAFEDLGSYSDSQEMARLCRQIAAYEQADALMEQGAYEEAATIFENLGDYRDSAEKAQTCRYMIPYSQAESFLAEGKLYEAATTFYSIRDFRDARDRSFAIWRELIPDETISVGSDYTTALRNDGTVLIRDKDANYFEIWEDIVSVSAKGDYMIGLKADGTVTITTLREIDGTSYFFLQLQFSDWTDIVNISASENHAVGLRSDGTVVATGAHEVDDWTDIVAVSAGSNHTLGLRADGTVVAVGDNQYGQCDVSDWTDIVAISAKSNYSVGLRSDGTVVAVGANTRGECNVSEWTDIVAIGAGYENIFGVRADGTVVWSGAIFIGLTPIRDWTDIVAISASGIDHNCVVGLKTDGSVVVAGLTGNGVSDLKDIRLPY